MLIRTLGGECTACGETNLSLLTIDHPEGVTWNRYQLRYDARVSRYIQEFCEGVRLRVLCMPCNGRFGWVAQMAEREPGSDEDDVGPDTDFVTPYPTPPF